MKPVTLFLILLSIATHAQKKIKTLEVSDTIIYATVDRPGDLYVLTKHGQMQKFDENGKLLVVYKNTKMPTLFDPRDGSRLFAYYRDRQLYEYLNPSFETTASFHVDSAFVIQPWLMCPSGDQKLWVLDEADNSLKRINIKDSEVEVEVNIDSAIDDVKSFTFMREYQGFVFLLDPAKGIYIFNAMGKYLRTISSGPIRDFNFLGEELYFMEGDTLKFIDLFSMDERTINLGGRSPATLLTDQRLYRVQTTSIEILKML
jgi:hypothetical protein